jgi:hypothetical protein
LHATVRALLSNINKYNQDMPSVYKCLKHLANNHAALVEFLVEELLRIERFIMTMEPKLDDDYYVAILIFLFNACNKNSSIIAQLPKYTHQHYYFLKNKFPHLFPDLTIQVLSASDTPHVYSLPHFKVQEITAEDEETDALLAPFDASFEQIRHLALAESFAEALKATNLLRKELSQLAATTRNEAKHQVQFFMMKAQLWNYFLCLMQEFQMATHSGFDDASTIAQRVIAVLYQSYKIQTLFSNLSEETMTELKLVRLVAHAYFLVAAAEQGQHASIKYQQIQRLRQLLRGMPANTVPVLEDAIRPLESSESQLDIQVLLQVIQNYFPTLHKQTSSIRFMTCRLKSPATNLEKTISFFSYVPLDIELEVQLRNLTPKQRSNLKALIHFEDGTERIFPLDSPQIGHLIRSKISLNVESWTEPSNALVTLICSYDQDLENEFAEFNSNNWMLESFEFASFDRYVVASTSKPSILLIHPHWNK